MTSLLLLLLPNVASNPKPGCSPVAIEDVVAAAECSKMIYDYYNGDGAEGKMLSENSKFKIVKEFDCDVKKEEKNGERREMIAKGHFLKAVIAQAEEDDDSTTTMFCFMGTKSKEQLNLQTDPFWSINDYDAPPHTCVDSSKCTLLKTDKECHDNENSVHVFDYDWNAFARFKSFIDEEFVPMIVAGQKYILTGHSLGGALSSLLAMKMINVKDGALWENKDSSLITFGQPRVGDKKFADLLDTIPNQKLRFVYHWDRVALVPLRNGKDSGYAHFSNEIWITDYLNGLWDYENRYIVCSPGDTYICSGQKSALTASSDDHGMANYLKALKKMASSPDKVKKFMKEVCDDEDSPDLKELQKKRKKAKKAKKVKKLKRKGKRAKTSKKEKTSAM